MSTEIRIKRGSGITPTLADGELGFNKGNKTLTIGTDTGNVDIGRPILPITFEEYNSLGNKDPNTIYIIKDEDLVTPEDDIEISNVGIHNATYRGKFLGNLLTNEQWDAIETGTFTDMYIGDYWTVGDINYRIAAFDYFYNTGDIPCNRHHITLIPDTPLYDEKMNSSNTIAGAYVRSYMRIGGLDYAKSIINDAFGSEHILNHRLILANAATDGYESGTAWFDASVELMSEHSVYGGAIFRNIPHGTMVPLSYIVDKTQYPLFVFRPDLISNGHSYWLRDVASDVRFAYVIGTGVASQYGAAGLLGVRPAFSIC